MISCCSCFGTKNTSKDEGIIGDKEDPIILQPKVSVKVSIILYPISFYTMALCSGSYTFKSVILAKVSLSQKC